MRRVIYWFGWFVLIALPLIYAVQIIVTQDLPRVEMWKWVVPFVAAVAIFLTRNRDDVLKHHVV